LGKIRGKKRRSKEQLEKKGQQHTARRYVASMDLNNNNGKSTIELLVRRKSRRAATRGAATVSGMMGKEGIVGQGRKESISGGNAWKSNSFHPQKPSALGMGEEREGGDRGKSQRRKKIDPCVFRRGGSKRRKKGDDRSRSTSPGKGQLRRTLGKKGKDKGRGGQSYPEAIWGRTNTHRRMTSKGGDSLGSSLGQTWGKNPES